MSLLSTPSAITERLRLLGLHLLTRPLRVGWDLDGVNYDFGDSVYRCLLSLDYPAERMTAPTHWHFYRDWGLGDQDFLDLCNYGVEAGIIFRTGTPLPGARQAMQRVMAAGHEIHIITDRSFGKNKASEHATRDWLAENQMPYTTLNFSRDKTSVPTDAMIDDKLENYDALTAAGTLAVLVNRPWNQIPGGDNRLRVNTLAEFVDILVANCGPALTTARRVPVGAGR